MVVSRSGSFFTVFLIEFRVVFEVEAKGNQLRNQVQAKAWITDEPQIIGAVPQAETIVFNLEVKLARKETRNRYSSKYSAL
jgi:hypothetical protein